MGKAKIGLIGLVGEEAKADFWATMENVARIGYQGIEGAAELLEGDAAANVRRFREMGLEVLTIGAKRERLREQIDAIIAEAKALETSRVTVWHGPCESKESLLEHAGLYNEAGRRLAAEGIRLCYHNHDHEFRTTFNGLYALDVLAEHTDPEALSFELDIAWATFGGADPVAALKRMAGRVPAVHVKDLYDLEQRGKFTAVGTGVVRVRESVEVAIETGVPWLVVEQDRLRNLTSWETLSLSYLYLKECGYA